MTEDPDKLKRLKEQLSSILQGDTTDFDQVLELSAQIAQLDQNNVRFSVDAGVIDRLGKELVARHETAVSELVKNAYDADASEVELLFKETNGAGGSLVIEDDGHGMTREQLVKGFMRISSTEKIHNPNSPTYNRERAGKKGIGRFAAQRLGKKLTIVTQTIDSDKALKIEIRWDNFNIDSNLIVIGNAISEVPKEREKGTTLTIEHLRESWTIAAIKRVYRYSIEVIQPFPLSKARKKINNTEDPGFLVRCFRSIGGNLEEIADEESMIFEHALAVIEGFVDTKGHGKWSITSNKIDANESDSIGKTDKDEKEPFKLIRNVHFKAYYYIYNIGKIPKMIQGHIQEKANISGGFKLYRNGFRVLPYGEPQNDWLGLDESVRRRVILPPHANNSFFGFVELNDPDGKIFNELSSREGLFKNEAFDELVDFIYRSILETVSRIAAIRNKKQKTGQKGWTKEEKTPTESVNEIADELDQLANTIESNSNDESDSNQEGNNAGDNSNQSSQEDAKERADRYRQLSEKLRSAAEQIEEIGMLRVLAGLGLTIGEFTHEIKQYLPAFDVDTNYLTDNLLENSEEFKRAFRLKDSFNSFKTYASYFDETISRNVQKELIPIELRDAVNGFVKVIEPDIQRSGFRLNTSYSGYDLFTCKMHPSEWASILFNLYSNSKKAIKRAKQQGEVLIKAGQEGDNVFIEFHDNGDGIPIENEEKIFTAFFTTSNQIGHSANPREELIGTGLGLKIIKDIIESYGGEILLSTPEKEYTTAFRIELPKASNEEIEEYDT